MGANLGYDVLFVLDACATFDRDGPDGTGSTATADAGDRDEPASEFATDRRAASASRRTATA